MEKHYKIEKNFGKNTVVKISTESRILVFKRTLYQCTTEKVEQFMHFYIHIKLSGRQSLGDLL